MAYGTVNADVIGTSVAGSNLGAGNASIMKNRIINGAMVIDQRNAGASVAITTSEPYITDRFKGYASQSGKLTAQQSSTAPIGFVNSLLATSLSAYTVGSSEVFKLSQVIEGFNIADLNWGSANSKTVTLSFQVQSSLTGTFGGALRNSADNYSYPFSYSIPVANTWTNISITIVGPTSGTWVTTNGAGIKVIFGLGCGSTVSGTAGSWSANYYESATGATSVVGTSGATFYITGVQLEVGSSATGFEYVNYQTSLANCQRYCFKMSTTSNYGPYGMGHGVNTTTFRTFIKTPQTLRAQPTLSFSTASGFIWSFGNALSAISAAEYGVDGFSIDCTSTGLAANGGYLLTSNNNTTSSIIASAEL